MVDRVKKPEKHKDGFPSDTESFEWYFKYLRTEKGTESTNYVGVTSNAILYAIQLFTFRPTPIPDEHKEYLSSVSKS
jgi:surface polysaccharide O-acyltransferase-like enzyme